VDNRGHGTKRRSQCLTGDDLRSFVVLSVSEETHVTIRVSAESSALFMVIRNDPVQIY